MAKKKTTTKTPVKKKTASKAKAKSTKVKAKAKSSDKSLLATEETMAESEKLFDINQGSSGLPWWGWLIFVGALIVAGNLIYSASEIYTNNDDPKVSESQEKVEINTSEDVEERVRRLVVMPSDEKFRNALLINTESALSELKETSPAVILDEARVGDYYVVFEGRAVVYRPSGDKVVYIVKVDNL